MSFQVFGRSVRPAGRRPARRPARLPAFRAVLALRRLSAAHPRAHLVLAAVLAIGAALTVADHEHAATAAQRAWRTTRTVLVAASDLRAGTPLGPDTVRRVALPLAALPRDAIGMLPTDPHAAAELTVGEVLSAHTVAAGAGADGLLPAGSVGVAVPLGNATWRPRLGDRVALVVAPDPTSSSGPPAPDPAAEASGAGIEGQVIGVADTVALVAVPRAAAPALAVAAAAGRVALVVESPAAAP